MDDNTKSHERSSPSLSPSLPSSLFMHELAIRSCFSGEGRSDAVGKCVSVPPSQKGKEKERKVISKVICMYVKKPMPLFCLEEESEQY